MAKEVTIKGFEDVEMSKPSFEPVVTRSWEEFEEWRDRLREWFPEAWFYFSTVICGGRVELRNSYSVKRFFEGKSVP